MSIISSVLVLAVFIYLTYKVGVKYGIHRLLLLALVTRLSFSFFNILGISFPLAHTSDIVAFIDHAELIAETGIVFNLSGSFAWATFLGIILRFTGDIVYIPLFINSFFGTLTVYFAYLISLKLFEEKYRAYIVAVIVSFLPPLVFASATYLREAGTILFVTMFFYYLVKYTDMRERNLSTVVLLFLTSIVAILFHGGFVFLPFIAVIYVLSFSLRLRMNYKMLAITLFLFLFIPIIISLMFTYNIGGGKVAGFYTLSIEPIMNAFYATVADKWVGAFAPDLIQRPIYLILLSFLMFLFSPLFDSSIRLFDLFRYPVIIIVFLSYVKMMVLCYRKDMNLSRFKSVSFISITFLIILFSLGSEDPSTAFRHYMKFFPVIIAIGFPLNEFKLLFKSTLKK